MGTFLSLTVKFSGQWVRGGLAERFNGITELMNFQSSFG